MCAVCVYDVVMVYLTQNEHQPNNMDNAFVGYCCSFSHNKHKCKIRWILVKRKMRLFGVWHVVLKVYGVCDKWSTLDQSCKINRKNIYIYRSLINHHLSFLGDLVGSMIANKPWVPPYVRCPSYPPPPLKTKVVSQLPSNLLDHSSDKYSFKLKKKKGKQ